MRLSTRLIAAAIVALGTIVLAALAQAQTATTKDQLEGTWRLESFRATSGGKVSYPLGEKPGGFIGFASSRYWVVIVDSGRNAPAAAALADAEAGALMKSSIAYTGKFDVDPAQTPDGIKITIHVDAAVNQAITGTNRVFFLRVDGNKLSFKSPAVVVPTTGLTSVVQLELVKAD
jgi:hypothetical protein